MNVNETIDIVSLVFLVSRAAFSGNRSLVVTLSSYYAHMPIGMLWIYRLLFVCVCVCPQDFL